MLNFHHSKYSLQIVLIIIAIFSISSISALYGQSIHDPLKTATITNEQVMDLGRLSQSLSEGQMTLDFEGLGNLEEIKSFYNGGHSVTGTSGYESGIEFKSGAMAIINAANGGSGNFAKKDLGATVLFSAKNDQIIINIDSGFYKEFSCYYTSVAPVTCSVFDAADGTGNLLATEKTAASTEAGVGQEFIFTSWKRLALQFSDVARSVVLTGNANMCAYDDLVFGSATIGKKQSSVSKTDRSNDSEFISLLSEPATTTERGKLFLTGGSRFGVNVGKEKQKSGGSVVENSESAYYDLDFLFRGGYYFLNNLVGGIYFDLELYNNKPSEISNGYKKGTTLIAGPFARFYVPVNDKLIPFAEAQVGFGIDNSRSKYSSSSDWIDSDQSVFTYRLGGGATYFINNMIGVDFFTGFQHDSYTYKDSDDGSSSSKYISNMFTLQLGIVFVLDVN